MAILLLLLAGVMAVVTAFTLQTGGNAQREWGQMVLAGFFSLLTFLSVQLALKLFKKSKGETQIPPPLPESFIPLLQDRATKSQGFLSLTTACLVTGQGTTETQKLLDQLISLNIIVKSRSDRGNTGYEFITKEDTHVRN